MQFSSTGGNTVAKYCRSNLARALTKWGMREPEVAMSTMQEFCDIGKPCCEGNLLRNAKRETVQPIKNKRLHQVWNALTVVPEIKELYKCILEGLDWYSRGGSAFGGKAIKTSPGQLKYWLTPFPGKKSNST